MENGGRILTCKKTNLNIDCKKRKTKKNEIGCVKQRVESWERKKRAWGLMGGLRVVLTFWIFYVLIVNFVCCYEFWTLL